MRLINNGQADMCLAEGVRLNPHAYQCHCTVCSCDFECVDEDLDIALNRNYGGVGCPWCGALQFIYRGIREETF